MDDRFIVVSDAHNKPYLLSIGLIQWLKCNDDVCKLIAGMGANRC